MHRRQCNPSSMKVSAKVSEFQFFRFQNRYFLRKLWKTTNCKRIRDKIDHRFLKKRIQLKTTNWIINPLLKRRLWEKRSPVFSHIFAAFQHIVCTGWGWQGLPTLSFGCRPSPNIQKATTTLQGKPFLLY